MSNQDFGFDPPAYPPLDNLAGGATPKSGQQLPPSVTTQSAGPDPAAQAAGGAAGRAAQTFFPRNYQYWTQPPPPIAALPTNPDVKAQPTGNPYAVPAVMEALQYAPGPEAVAGRMAASAATELGGTALSTLAARQAMQYGINKQYSQSQTPSQAPLVGGSPEDAHQLSADQVIAGLNSPDIAGAGVLALAKTGHLRGSLSNRQSYLMLDQSGNEVGNMEAHDYPPDRVHIQWMSTPQGDYNALGPESIRSLLPEIRREYPTAKRITMYRAGGARLGPASVSDRGQHVTFNIPENIQANPPNKWSSLFLHPSGVWRPLSEQQRSILTSVAASRFLRGSE